MSVHITAHPVHSKEGAGTSQGTAGSGPAIYCWGRSKRGLVPEGLNESSPAIYCSVLMHKGLPVPAGTIEALAFYRVATPHGKALVDRPLRDETQLFSTAPRTEVLGYSHQIPPGSISLSRAWKLPLELTHKRALSTHGSDKSTRRKEINERN
jgi:hypothetical protein